MAADDIVVRHRNRTHQAPWCGVGKSGHWDNYMNALEDSGIDFYVEQKTPYIKTSTSSPFVKFPVWNEVPVPGVMANVKAGTDEILGVVSNQYGIVQNTDAFGLIQPFVDAGAVIEHAGMTAQGMCFMVARMATRIVNGDSFEFYICMTNSFNTKFPLALFVTPVRVICQNMFRGLMRGNENMVRIKHGSNSEERMLSANDNMKVAGDMIAKFEDDAHRLANKEFDAYDMLPVLFPDPDRKNHNWQLSMQRVEAMRDTFISEYYMVPDNAKYRDTAFGFLNAYFDYLSHRPESRGNPDDWEQRRFSGLLSGKDVSRKVIAEVMR